MRKATVDFEVFSYDELGAEAKKKAYELWAEGQCTDNYWYDSVYESVETLFNLFGITLDDKGNKHWRRPSIYFSGFFSQGDGASFTGTYRYKKGWKEAVKAEFPTLDLKALSAMNSITSAMSRYFYSPEFTISANGYYCHSGTMSIDQSHYDDKSVAQEDEREILSGFRKLADYVYSMLEKEYYYQTSEDCFLETDARENEYLANGKVFHG